MINLPLPDSTTQVIKIRSQYDSCAKSEKHNLKSKRGRKSAAVGELTGTQNLITRQILAGKSNAQIAELFEISTKTVKFHLTKIFKKKGVKNRLELAVKELNTLREVI